MRVGSFNIPAVIVRDNPGMCARAMTGMCVVRCEFIYSTDRFHYEAICDDFDDIALGETVPHYTLVMQHGDRIGVERKE